MAINEKIDGLSENKRDNLTPFNNEDYQSKQVSAAILTLLFYSLLMFTLPFGAFFGTQYALKTYTDLPDFTITALSVTSSVITVYIIIALYVWKAYNEKEIVTSEESKDDLKNQNSVINKKLH